MDHFGIMRGSETAQVKTGFLNMNPKAPFPPTPKHPSVPDSSGDAWASSLVKRPVAGPPENSFASLQKKQRPIVDPGLIPRDESGGSPQNRVSLTTCASEIVCIHSPIGVEHAKAKNTPEREYLKIAQGSFLHILSDRLNVTESDVLTIVSKFLLSEWFKDIGAGSGSKLIDHISQYLLVPSTTETGTEPDASVSSRRVQTHSKPKPDPEYYPGKQHDAKYRPQSVTCPVPQGPSGIGKGHGAADSSSSSTDLVWTPAEALDHPWWTGVIPIDTPEPRLTSAALSDTLYSPEATAVLLKSHGLPSGFGSDQKVNSLSFSRLQADTSVTELKAPPGYAVKSFVAAGFAVAPKHCDTGAAMGSRDQEHEQPCLSPIDGTQSVVGGSQSLVGGHNANCNLVPHFIGLPPGPPSRAAPTVLPPVTPEAHQGGHSEGTGSIALAASTVLPSVTPMAHQGGHSEGTVGSSTSYFKSECGYDPPSYRRAATSHSASLATVACHYSVTSQDVIDIERPSSPLSHCRGGLNPTDARSLQ